LGKLRLRMKEVLARIQERLRRNAPHVHAGATQGLVLFYTSDLESELSRADRGRITARTTADDDEVELFGSGHLVLQSELLGMLEVIFQRDQECDGPLAFDQAMIIRKREVHHGANLDLPIHRDRTVLDLMHSQNPALRRVQDRRREKRAVDAAVRDGKSPSR